MYGAQQGESSYANNCLLARRLVERGVRFVQLYHADWDHHDDLTKPLDTVCQEIDKPTAALIRDLKQRGLLDRTLVIWGGEFGRTPMGEVREKGKIGRNHHIDSFSLFFAGGGLQHGIAVGSSDELGFSPSEEKTEIFDVHATVLHLLGIDHTKLTYRFQGREFRLTDVGGRLIQKMLA
jgi:membrane-anchored protein YejM (alkaline phosphatase superfamily)